MAEIYREELNCLVSVQGLEGQLSPRQSAGRSHCSFGELSLCRYRQVPYLSFHQPGLHSCPGDSLRPPLYSNHGVIKAASRAFFIQKPFLATTMDCPIISQRPTNPRLEVSGFSIPHTPYSADFSLALDTTGLSSHFELSHAPESPPQMVTVWRLLCAPCHRALRGHRQWLTLA